MSISINKAGVFIDKALVSAAMGQARSLPPGKHAIFESELFKQKVIPGTIIADVVVWGDAEKHANESELWICLEGSAKFIYGGVLDDPWQKDSNTLDTFAKSITGGTEVIMNPGDVLYIRAGQPHQHGAEKIALLAIIKIPN